MVENGRSRPLLKITVAGTPVSQDLSSLLGVSDMAGLSSSPLESRVVAQEIRALSVHFDPWFSAEIAATGSQRCPCGDGSWLLQGSQRRVNRRCREMGMSRCDYRPSFSTTFSRLRRLQSSLRLSGLHLHGARTPWRAACSAWLSSHRLFTSLAQGAENSLAHRELACNASH